MKKLHILIIDDYYANDTFLDEDYLINSCKSFTKYYTFSMFAHRDEVPKDYECDIVIVDIGEIIDNRECTQWFKKNFPKKHLFFMSALGPSYIKGIKRNEYLNSIPALHRPLREMIVDLTRFFIDNDLEMEHFKNDPFYLMHYKDKREKFVTKKKCVCGHKYISFEDEYRHNRHCKERK